MNYNNIKQETARMMELMNYGLNESKSSTTQSPKVEYSTKAADGKTYGIVCEGTKFYIKVAPKKDTQILAEDFDYIGGAMNKKQNEYRSYALASRNLDLKLMQINEANKASKVQIETVKTEAPEWQINETKEMRAAIDRCNQISRNVASILNEGFTTEHTLPEAPASNPSDKKVNDPYTDTAVAKGDKDFKETSNDHTKAGGPFNNDVKVEMASDKKPQMSGDNGVAFSEKAKYAPKNSIAHSTANGGKVTRADESKSRTVKLTEEQVLAWNRENDDYMDKSNGTKIGSSAPFEKQIDGKQSNQGEAPTEHIHESEGPIHNTNKLYPNGGTGEVGKDGDPFVHKTKSAVEGGSTTKDHASNGVIAEGDGAYLDFERDYSDYLDNDYDDYDEDFVEYLDSFGSLNDLINDPRAKAYAEKSMKDDSYDPDEEDLSWEKDAAVGPDVDDIAGMEEDDEDLDLNEGIIYELELNEQTLNDFGKHPAYRKKPMTLPANKEVAINGAREWDDESVKGEEPFGKKIGSSAPFEKAVDKITNSIMEQLGF